MNKKSTLQLLVWTILSTVIACIGIATLMVHTSPTILRTWLDTMTLPLTIIRCSLYVMVFMGWPSLMRHLARRHQWDENYLAHLIGQRYKLFFSLILLELVLAQNIVGRLIHFLLSL